MSVPATDASACSLLPTPTATVVAEGQDPETWLAQRAVRAAKWGFGPALDLTRALKLLPTPNAGDGDGGKLHAPGSISPTGMKADGTKVQVSLRDALTMLSD
jgi:hypothetical protein